MVELVDTAVLEAAGEILGGSNPLARTTVGQYMIRELFLEEQVGGPVFDIDVRSFVLTGKITVEPRFGRRVEVPILDARDFSENDLEEAAAKLLLAAANYCRGSQELEKLFESVDLPLRKVLTHKDHKLIPTNCVLGVTDPEYMGRFLKTRNQIGMVVLNPFGVLGYIS